MNIITNFTNYDQNTCTVQYLVKIDTYIIIMYMHSY